MNNMSNTWALVLAAGEGKRLNSLTTDALGRSIPKQFCSLNGGESLLQETLRRAEAVVSPERTAVVVAEQHESFWRPTLSHLAPANLIEQPANRGTGNGLLLPLLQILDADPKAVILILPSDHYVGNERPLRQSMKRSLRLVAGGSAEIVMLGIEPEQVDDDLGYILPAGNDGWHVHSVSRFVEKPQGRVAEELIAQGALWNSFIMAVNGQALLNLYAARFPEVVQAMVEALTSAPEYRKQDLRHLYEKLPDIDFSRHVISGAERHLSVLAVPRCGWSDLGTPNRVGATIARLKPRAAARRVPATANLNLTNAHFRLQHAS